MSTLIGTATKPNGAGGWESWSSTYNQGAELLTMPERGQLVSVGFWSAGVNQTASVVACIWDDAGVLLGQSLSTTMAGQTPASGHVDLYVLDLIVPLELDAGVDFYAGFSRAPGRSHQLTGGASGGGQHFDNKRATWPGTMEPNDTGGHVGPGSDYRIGCHAFYDPVRGAWVRRGGLWVRAEGVFVRRAGAWVQAADVQVRRAGAWVDAD